MPKVLIAGAGGQLARELVHTTPADVQCLPLGMADMDIAESGVVRSVMEKQRPDVVINAAAYTAVDLAESEPAAAYSANATGPANLAEVCRDLGIRLLHVSTDFVFDGNSGRPYKPLDSTAPLGEYGRSKLAGERAVHELLPEAVILRTGWVYSAWGANFVKTMLKLMAEREELSVVADQVGTPTWARGLAQALWRAAERPNMAGIYHWSDAGVCSWYDFAVAISEEGQAAGLLTHPVRIRPIPAAEYPTPAARPAFSVLDKTSSWQELDAEAVHWREQLRRMLKELMEQDCD